MAYSLVKYVHVLLAITAVGSNITYAAWNARGSMDPQHLGFALRGIKFIDDYIANPCYALLPVTGLALRFIGFNLWPRWMISAIVLYIVLVVVALAGYSPALRRQVKALEAEGATSATYLKWAGRARLTGIISGVFALVIVFLMVVKPAA
ncbi:MAG TPA: DUF2269 family protein [Candidatus Dormibacteraeota bacterium]|jgi:uncharacterized membrane protein|nr:DUF2269 family protein [Candidatus Dormibacteraeota bacterium]